MSKVKFLRGSSSNLSKQPLTDGQIYLTTDQGKFYIDALNADNILERFLINQDNPKQILFDTVDGWNSIINRQSQKDIIYVYTNYKQDADGNYIPGIKIGDGNAYLIDMPFIDEIYDKHIQDNNIHISATEREKWNNKISCSLDSKNQERLIFSID